MLKLKLYFYKYAIRFIRRLQEIMPLNEKLPYIYSVCCREYTKIRFNLFDWRDIDD
jgi:hypothetical protein